MKNGAMMIDFYKRFLKHNGACFGLILLVCSVALVLYSFFNHDLNPYIIRPWLIAVPPLKSVPTCLEENSFELNQPLPDQFKATQEKIEITTFLRHRENYRILLKAGTIESIREMKTSKQIQSLDIVAEGRVILSQLFKSAEKTILTHNLSLTVGNKLPNNVSNEAGVVILEKEIWTPFQNKYKITVEQGKVSKILMNGLSQNSITLRGEDVVLVVSDDKIQTTTFWFGTDMLGRDLLSRVMYGGRVSLMVAVVATLVSLIVGVCYGAIAGYCGGKTERLMMSAVDIMYAIPFMFLVIILLVNFGRNIVVLFIALGAVLWLTMSRIVCSVTKRLRTGEFVEAALLCGASHRQIIFSHLLPNMFAPIIIYATLTVPAVILEESFLSFIGLSVQYGGKTLDSWGTLVFQGIEALGSDGSRLWILLAPAVAMVVTLIGFNLLGDGLRDILDPKHQNN